MFRLRRRKTLQTVPETLLLGEVKDIIDSRQRNRNNQFDPFGLGELRDKAEATLRKNFHQKKVLSVIALS